MRHLRRIFDCGLTKTLNWPVNADFIQDRVVGGQVFWRSHENMLLGGRFNAREALLTGVDKYQIKSQTGKARTLET